jgi:hypothetical protein
MIDNRVADLGSGTSVSSEVGLDAASDGFALILTTREYGSCRDSTTIAATMSKGRNRHERTLMLVVVVLI